MSEQKPEVGRRAPAWLLRRSPGLLNRLGKPLPVVERVASVMGAKRIRKEEAKVVKKGSTNGQVFGAASAELAREPKSVRFQSGNGGRFPVPRRSGRVEVARG